MTSHLPARRSATLPVLGALLAAGALAGCGAGRHNETYSEVSAVDGAAGTFGPVQVRDMEIDGPVVVGGDGVLEFSLHSAAAPASPDTLQAITTDETGTAPLQLFTVSGSTLTPVASITTPALVPGPARFAAQLVGLPTGLKATTYVKVTLVFKGAGTHTLTVPVRRADAPNSTPSLTILSPSSAP